MGGNRQKFKICVFFLKITINCTDLLLFAAFWTAFNVCSMLRSLYVHCMFNVSFSGRRPETETNLVLQETIHLWNHVPYTWHATYLDNPDWPDLSPSYASLCAGAWSMVACSGWVCWMWIWPAGQKQKEMLFRDGWWTKSCTSTWKDNLDGLMHPLYPLVQCWVSFVIEVVQDFGHSTSFFLTTKHYPNVTEGVRGLVLGCK